MNLLGIGLRAANHFEDALSVQEADLSTLRRLGESEDVILAVQSNLAITYQCLGRIELALRLRQDVYSGRLKLNGNESKETLIAANNYALSLVNLRRCAEAKALLRKTVPVARRVCRDCDENTLRLRWNYARAVFEDNGATLGDLREAVTMLEDTAPIARRALGGAHPLTADIECYLRDARALLRGREARA